MNVMDIIVADEMCSLSVITTYNKGCKRSMKSVPISHVKQVKLLKSVHGRSTGTVDLFMMWVEGPVGRVKGVGMGGGRVGGHTMFTTAMAEGVDK